GRGSTPRAPRRGRPLLAGRGPAPYRPYPPDSPSSQAHRPPDHRRRPLRQGRPQPPVSRALRPPPARPARGRPALCRDHHLGPNPRRPRRAARSDGLARSMVPPLAARVSRARHAMIIMKFGGSSVANREQIHKVLDIVRSRIDRAPLVVSSAHKGITDALVNAARTTARGQIDRSPIDRQRQIAAELGCPDALLEPFYDELSDLLRGISLVKELSPRSLDYVSSFGERMSVRAIADYFTRQGLPARAYDVWDLGFVTDSKFNCARPVEGWEQVCREAVARLPKG